MSAMKDTIDNYYVLKATNLYGSEIEKSNLFLKN